MKIKDAVHYGDQLAPLASALDWDNSGLLVGDPEEELTGILTALDATLPVVMEAEAKGRNLIVTHHPVIFHPQKRFTAGSVPFEAARRGISILSLHTCYDMAPQGVNQILAETLGLENIRPLLLEKRINWKKLVTYVPRDQAEQLYEALSRAGCGDGGDYSGVCFFTQGQGRFRPMEGSHPVIGAVGRTEQVEEVRLETAFPPHLEARVVEVLRQNHPYEKPVWDIWTLENFGEEHWIGCVGELPEPLSPEAFARLIRERLRIAPRYNPGGELIYQVGLCGGSGGELMGEAMKAHGWKYQAFVTAEVKHHQFMEAQQLGVTLYDASHYATEVVSIPWLTRQLAQGLGPELPISMAEAYQGQILD